MDNKKLDGKVAVISGASRGLGRAMAVRLASAGAKLALVARDGDKLAPVADEIRKGGGEARYFLADVAREEDVRHAEREVLSAFGRADILINNAGINIRKQLIDYSLEEWHKVLDTNLTSVFLMCRSFVPYMKGTGYGRVINITSIMSWVSLPGRGAYTASKGGMLAVTRTLALELAPHSITVNSISPGLFATEMNTVLLQTPEIYNDLTSRIPLARWGRLEEIGQLALYLCSPGAAFITGTDIVIDGGWCTQ
jgi:NAD(P)-dependent dehydrogenase (short-subunit alcohol dehydrogenase family)